jgi:hypothetical protein
MCCEQYLARPTAPTASTAPSPSLNLTPTRRRS